MNAIDIFFYLMLATLVAAAFLPELAANVLMSGALVAPTPLDRLQKAFNSLSRAADPRRTFFGLYEYAVQKASADGTTVDATPTDTTLSLPGIVQLPVRLPISTATLGVGQKCIVYFVNGDPTRPAVLSSDPVPSVATFDASTTLNLGPSAGTVNVGASANTVAIAGGAATAYPLRNGEQVTVTIVSTAGAWPSATGTAVATIVVGPAEVAPGPPGIGHSKAVA